MPKVTKKWYQSRTIWVGVITALIGALSFIETHQGASITTIASGILMIVLRTLTTEPVQ